MEGRGVKKLRLFEGESHHHVHWIFTTKSYHIIQPELGGDDDTDNKKTAPNFFA